MARYARRPPGIRRPLGPWKHGSVPVVGVIGGIGAGKSRVAAALERRGAIVLDADAVGHVLLDQRPTREAIRDRFGDDVLVPAGPDDDGPRVDRGTLAGIVFNKPSELRALEAILHPRMRRTFEKAINRIARRREGPMVVLDAAVLLEAGWDDLCDYVLFVEAPEALRRERVARSRGWNREQHAAREAAQWPLGRKRSRADFDVANDAGPDRVESRIAVLWCELLQPPGRSRPPEAEWSGDAARSSTKAPAPAPERPGGPPRRPGTSRGSKAPGARGRGNARP